MPLDDAGAGRPVVLRLRPMVAEIKGLLLNGWMRFLRERFGAEPVAQAIETLGPEDQRLLSSVFLPSSWYRYDALHGLRRLTRLLATPADRNLAVEIGRAMAHQAFTGVYRPLLCKDPSKQVEQFPATADFFFRETRKLETEMLDASSCIVRHVYQGGARPTRAICASTMGFWGQTLELAGASKVESEHPRCAAQGGSVCEYAFRWQL